MNQTKKRLQIINIAISITDIETIQLQMLKLASLRSDEKLQEIIAGLQAQNYAQTQSLITTYIETPMEEIVQRTSQNDKDIIEEFDLFVTTPETPIEKETELFDFDTLVKEIPEKAKENPRTEAEQNIDFDNLLNLTAEDVMPNNIELDISHTPQDDFFDTAVKENGAAKESHIDTNFIPKDDFFDHPEPFETSTQESEKDILFHNLPQEEEKEEENSTPLFKTENTPAEETDISAPAEKTVEEELEGHSSSIKEEAHVTKPEEGPLQTYKNIPYIDQKLKNMLTQYPPLHTTQEHYDSVNNWLLKISNEGYSEKEVEEVISYIAQLKEGNNIAEAAQLLLICGATASKYAQFMLARELFRGEVLEKNLPEAFTLINRLAMDDDYPEAICDLAQFYENGIGIDKDRQRAETLYREAMELGVKRAKTHYERVQKANRGLLGKLFGK
ncbi:tetratricopeptide repeat protein [Sulfurovum sp.]|uniref:tetratricopeptide repeat protein n=1 Tax=Sulfurovum sp. TaxID=1969726 RepID=UPI0025DF2DBF|nr:tetratricopeptide repeat protein [Sulfurovum sp.]